MRLGVRFTVHLQFGLSLSLENGVLQKLLWFPSTHAISQTIEEGFCKNAWTSDINRPEATRRHRSKEKSREFEYLKYWYILSGMV